MYPDSPRPIWTLPSYPTPASERTRSLASTRRWRPSSQDEKPSRPAPPRTFGGLGRQRWSTPGPLRARRRWPGRGHGATGADRERGPATDLARPREDHPRHPGVLHRLPALVHRSGRVRPRCVPDRLCQDLLEEETAFRPRETSAPACRDVFADDPWVSACAQRPIPSGDAASAARAHPDVPMPLLSRALDSFRPAAPLRALAAGSPRTWTVEVPGQTHNVLGSRCAIDFRNAWVRAPSSRPISPTCYGR